ncbi:MAG: alpha-hydroxy acid oxidase, partial [Robiginitomaculum sp.]|nr:alpha-hydroxy acid oxidase [Robiginitomaculum sp.]
DFAAHTDGPKLFQLYVFKDPGLTRDLIARAKAAKIDALCLTVDTPVGGNRERDLVTGMSVPPRFTPASLLSIALHPKWVWGVLQYGKIRMENVADWIEAQIKTAGGGAAAYIDARFDQTLNWDDAKRIAREWGGPFVIKGIMTPGDAIRARDIGACGVMISNHGGRQLDGAPAPIDMVAPIREAVGDRLELVVDGGVRRGSHIVKALALGADACSIGRPFLYGLAAGGEDGVARVLKIFSEEFERTMALMGCPSLAHISDKHVQGRNPKQGYTNVRSRKHGKNPDQSGG